MFKLLAAFVRTLSYKDSLLQEQLGLRKVSPTRTGAWALA